MSAIAEALAAKDAEIARLKEERDEARGHASHWHRVGEAIATILGLSLPEADFAAAVRQYDDGRREELAALTRQILRKDAALRRLLSYDRPKGEIPGEVWIEIRAALQPTGAAP